MEKYLKFGSIPKSLYVTGNEICDEEFIEDIIKYDEIKKIVVSKPDLFKGDDHRTINILVAFEKIIGQRSDIKLCQEIEIFTDPDDRPNSYKARGKKYEKQDILKEYDNDFWHTKCFQEFEYSIIHEKSGSCEFAKKWLKEQKSNDYPNLYREILAYYGSSPDLERITDISFCCDVLEICEDDVYILETHLQDKNIVAMIIKNSLINQLFVKIMKFENVKEKFEEILKNKNIKKIFYNFYDEYAINEKKW